MADIAVFGPLFQTVHLQVDELLEFWRGLAGKLDLASQAVLIGVASQLEKQRWMLRVQLRERA